MKGTTLILAGMMLAGMTFATHAAKPDSTPEQRKAKVEAISKNRAAFKASQPITMSQATTTARALPGGGAAIRVPTELWNTLSVEQSADGRLRVVEADGTAPAPKTAEVPHE